LDELYQKELLRLAALAVGHGRLADADASATVDNPLCGDRVTVDLKRSDGRVAQVGHVVQACLLCQAAASIIGAHAAGHTAVEIEAVRSAVADMLTGTGSAPDGEWSELAAFAPVAAHKSRHTCVLLPFDALLRAAAEPAEASF